MSLPLGKMYYSISEVCRETGLEQHVLRYWETEFPTLKPKKNRAGNRAYRPKEIDLIKYIKYLLYDEQFTIQGAKKKLAVAKGHSAREGGEGRPDGEGLQRFLPEIRENLLKLKSAIDDILTD